MTFPRPIQVKYKRLHPDAIEPTRAHEDSAAYDLRCVLTATTPDGEIGISQTLAPGTKLELRTGLAVEIPPGHVMVINSRSGAGFEYDVSLSNGQGWIDPDYRGEVKVSLTHKGSGPAARDFRVTHKDRVAQLVVIPVPDVHFLEVTDLSLTKRGAGGFGSTGAE